MPTYPHTGYGYIESDARSLVATPINSFIEKPNQGKAVDLLETNRFFFVNYTRNSGEVCTNNPPIGCANDRSAEFCPGQQQE